MTRKVSLILFTLLFVPNSMVFDQGRVDTDPILYNIWWNTWKIDNDRTLKCNITSINTPNDTSGFMAYYSRNDSIFKIIKLRKRPAGTQMTCYYFIDNKPVFILVKENDYYLLNNKTTFSKAVSSFEDIIDTSFSKKKPVSKPGYQAQYFFYRGNVRYSSIMTGKLFRVDKQKDITEGLKMFNEAGYYLANKKDSL